MSNAELNMQLYNACIEKAPNYSLIEDLLKKGANPLGKIPFYDHDNYTNLYDLVMEERVDFDIDEPFYKITELFVKYGMDISKPEVPYDWDFALNPMWSFAFYSDEWTLKTLKLLLDNGLRAEDVNLCWTHEISDFVDLDCSLTSKFTEESFLSYIRKLMLIASYPHVLDNDEALRKEIWYGYKFNNYDLLKFRNWNDFEFDIDTSRCEGRPEIYKSVVTIIEKNSKKPVWKFGVCLTPDEL